MMRFNCLVAAAVAAAIVAAIGSGVVGADPSLRKSDPNWVRPQMVGTASDPGGFALDEKKLRKMFPDFEWTADQIGYLGEYLKLADSRAAIVASVSPLVVSAYSDELDGVILVRFPDELATEHSLKVGDHLIACWTYPSLDKPPSDVVQGERSTQQFENGSPLIADFFSRSTEKIKERKEGVPREEWNRVEELTGPALTRAGGQYRSSFPLDVGLPPELLKAQPAEPPAEK